MAYTPTNWVDDNPPFLNASNLNKIESGIKDAHDDITLKADTSVVGSLTGRVSALEGAPAPTVDWDDVQGKPSTFTPSAHTHAISDVTNLQSELNGKQAAGSYAAGSHTHDVADIDATGTPSSSTYLRGDGTWATPAGGGGGAVDSVNGQTGTVVLDNTDVGAAAASHTHTAAATVSGTFDADRIPTLSQSKISGLSSALSTKADSAHNHAISDVTGLQGALDGKQAAGSYAAVSHSHDASAITGGTLDAARIPSLAQSKITDLVSDLAGKAAAVHTHDVDDLNTTGTPDGTKFLRDDGTWATPSGGGGGGAVDSVNGQTGTVVLDNTDVGAAAAAHTHAWGDITSKPTSFEPSSHTHTMGQVSGLNGALQAKVANAAGISGGIGTIWTGTQAEYDGIGSKSASTLYVIVG